MDIYNSLIGIFEHFENTISNDYNLYINLGNESELETGDTSHFQDIFTRFNTIEKKTLIIFFSNEDINIEGIKSSNSLLSLNNSNNSNFNYLGYIQNLYYFYQVPFMLPQMELNYLQEIINLVLLCNGRITANNCDGNCQIVENNQRIYMTGNIDLNFNKINLDGIMNNIDVNFINFLIEKCLIIINNQNFVHLNNGWFFNTNGNLNLNGNTVYCYNNSQPIFVSYTTNAYLTSCIYFYKLIKVLKESMLGNNFTMSLGANLNIIPYQLFRYTINYVTTDNYFP